MPEKRNLKKLVKKQKKCLTFKYLKYILTKVFGSRTRKNGILAQLGEHLPYKQRVTGSSPVGPILLKVSIKYGEVAQLARASGSYPGG